MDISPTKQAIDRFFTRLGVLFRAKATIVGLADNALKWMSQNKAGVIANVKAGSADHIAARNNPHVVTPSQINAYSKAELDAMLTGRVPVGVLPISRYGALNFLPVGVSGSYEGAIAPTDNLHVALNVEDDGTLVILRAGTDGGVKGIYYSYVLDPLNQAVAMNIRVTSRRYAPPFLANAGRLSDMLFRSTRDVIFGRCADANGVISLFFAMANGTFDDSGHVGSIMPTSLIPDGWCDTDGSWNCSRVDVTYHNGRVYVMHLRGTNNEGMWIVVHSISEAEIRAGNITEVRRESGWTVTDQYGITRSGETDVRMTRSGVRTTAGTADYPWLTWEGQPGQNLSVTLIRAGTQRASLQGTMENGVYYGNAEQQMQFNWSVPGESSRSTWNVWQWSYEIDFTNKRAKATQQLGVDGATPVAPFTVTLNGIDISYSGKLADNMRGSVSDRGTDYVYLRETQPDGSSIPVYIFSNMNWWGSYSHQLIRRKYAQAARIADVMDMGQQLTPTYTSSTNFQPAFGGAFGRRFGAPIFLGGSKIMTHCEGNAATGRFQEHVAYGDVGFETSFTYPSLDFGTLQGAAPRAYRQELGEYRTGVSELTYSIMNETSLSDLNSFTVDQVTLAEGYRTIAYRGINAALDYTHTLAINPAVYASARTMMQNKAINEFGHTLTSNENDFRVEFIIPRNAPSLIAATYRLANGDAYTILMLAEPNTKNGTITSFTYDQASTFALRSDTATTSISINGSTQRRVGSMCYIETPNYWVFSGQLAWHMQRSGSSGYPSSRWVINKATRKFDKVSIGTSDVANGMSKRQFIPGKGMCISRCNSGYDSFSKITYTVEADTEDGLVNLTSKNTPNYVLASMLKPAQWNVSFTEPTDVILSGRKYVLDPLTVFLNELTADPANKTFYVYVRLVAGKLVYAIQLDEVPESAINMFIGTIVTGSTSITSLNINKVTRLGNYRPSATAIGAAISVSGGAPQDIVPLNWN